MSLLPCFAATGKELKAPYPPALPHRQGAAATGKELKGFFQVWFLYPEPLRQLGKN
jgi:hypothetical protein